MKLIFKKAALEDIDVLTNIRTKVLRAANSLSADADMTEVEQHSYHYYKKALADGTHIAYMVYDNKIWIGTGGISFYQVMPTYHNPSGEKAYIMNMYTVPEYRKNGIAYQTLKLLVECAQSKGITAISLEATAMGKPLYKKFGCIRMKNEMELPTSP